MSHWKTLFDYKHLGCHDLPELGGGKYQDIVVTITKLESREVTTEGGKKEILPVADLAGAKKPMIINKTNFRILEALFGTGEYKSFEGKTVTLYAAKVKGKGGGIVDGLRIKDKLPAAKQKEELTPIHPRWDGAKKSIASGDVTIERLKESFILSLDNEKLLCQQ